MTDDDGWRSDRVGSLRAGTNPTVLARLPQSYAVIGDTQFLPGYCVLVTDDPSIDRLTDLPRSARLEFLESMDVLGLAVERACRGLDAGFRRLNYEILGNTDASCTLTSSRATSGSPRTTSAGRSGSTTQGTSTDLTPRWGLVTTRSGPASSPSWRTSAPA